LELLAAKLPKGNIKLMEPTYVLTFITDPFRTQPSVVIPGRFRADPNQRWLDLGALAASAPCQALVRSRNVLLTLERQAAIAAFAVEPVDHALACDNR
jgi:hypothetical protein